MRRTFTMLSLRSIASRRSKNTVAYNTSGIDTDAVDRTAEKVEGFGCKAARANEAIEAFGNSYS